MKKVHVTIVEICGISFNPHNNSVGRYHSFVNHYIMVFQSGSYWIQTCGFDSSNAEVHNIMI